MTPARRAHRRPAAAVPMAVLVAGVLPTEEIAAELRADPVFQHLRSHADDALLHQYARTFADARCWAAALDIRREVGDTLVTLTEEGAPSPDGAQHAPDRQHAAAARRT